jgi:hypothetical protein
MEEGGRNEGCEDQGEKVGLGGGVLARYSLQDDQMAKPLSRGGKRVSFANIKKRGVPARERREKRRQAPMMKKWGKSLKKWLGRRNKRGGRDFNDDNRNTTHSRHS